MTAWHLSGQGAAFFTPAKIQISQEHFAVDSFRKTVDRFSIDSFFVGFDFVACRAPFSTLDEQTSFHKIGKIPIAVLVVEPKVQIGSQSLPKSGHHSN